ncbi:MAG: polysaccharide deacetylase family protein [Clostridiales bacterium]|nr:polysaccharide deacetylase family protein [Clostridiales bacterium]
MKKHKNIAARFAMRLSGMILTAAVLLTSCVIPSRVRAKTDPTADFIDRTYELLAHTKADDEIFAFWYRNLSSGNISATSMIDMLIGSPQLFIGEDGSLQEGEALLDSLSLLMTEKALDPQQKSQYLDYMAHGVSIRRVLFDLSVTPEYFGICGRYVVKPEGLTELSPRDQEPELTKYVYDMLSGFTYGRPATNEECDEWCRRFMDGQEVAQAIDDVAKTGTIGGRTMSDEEKVSLIYRTMVGQEITAEDEALYQEALENGMSMSYVVKKISETALFQRKCSDLQILAGTVELTEPRDNNYELTSFLTRMYTRFAGQKPTAEDLNAGVKETLEDPGRVREVITQMLSTPESQALLESDEDFLNTVFEVFYGYTPEESRIKAYLIGMSNGITRTRVLSEILKDPAFDEKMAEYGIDTRVEKIVPEKIVALTFDDGPYTPVTMRILDALEPYGAHATFFVVGNRIANYSECLIRATNLGCEIADHTWNHTTLTRISGDAVSRQIWDCADAVYNLTGVCPRVMRPVGGSYNSTVSANVGMPMIIWSVDTNDWKYRDSNHVINEILNNVRDGDIILMHDLYETTADAVEYVVPALIEAGYTLVTVSELAEYKGIDMENGKAYFSMRG